MGFISRAKDIFFPVMESFMKGSLNTYCDIETVDGSNLIMKDGSICSVFSFDGALELMGHDVLYNTSNTMAEKLAPSFAQTGHAIQVVFSRSPDTTHEIVKNIIKGPRYSARRLDMNLDGLFDEQEEMLTQEIYNETCYFFLWTRSNILSKNERKQELKQNQKLIDSFWGTLFAQAGDIQSIVTKSKLLDQRHETFKANFKNDLTHLGLVLKALDGDQAINAIINNIYPDRINQSFKIKSPTEDKSYGLELSKSVGGNVKKGHWMRPNAQDDMSFLLWPKVSEQIFIEDGKHINSNIVRLGNLYSSSVAMTLGPQNVKPFTEFVNNMPRIPYRVCFSIEGDGLSGMRTKEVLATITSITNKGHNGPLAREINQMTEVKNHGGTLDSAIVRIRVNFATWCNVSAGQETIERRTTALIGAVERWGFCQATSSSGDPMGGVLSSVGGLTMQSTAPFGAAPLPEITYMLPLQRETSPWDYGWPFKTNDDKIFPFMSGSSKQDTFADIIYATPGKGKSVLMNTINLAFCLSEQNISGQGGAQLPPCRILDIGYSSQGLITLLQAALPENRRHEVLHLRMSKDPAISAINIFDTPLGCRKPISYDKDFIVNFISIFLETKKDGVPRFASNVISNAVDELYARYTDKGDINTAPKLYRKGQCFEIDEEIIKCGMKVVENETTWWTIVDRFMFTYKNPRLAGLAQRYAVPVLEDLYSLDMTRIEETYGEAQDSGMSVIQIFKMAISGIIREYPILNAPTKVDFTSARVVALDLQYVCGDESEMGNKQTSIMYMLGRFVTTKGFFYGPEDINNFEPEYRRYHKPILQRNQSSPKRINYDEFHKTGGSPSVRAQIVKDMREGRKWKVQVALASQKLEDFGDDIISFASSSFILGVNDYKDVVKSIDHFNLSYLAGKIMERDLKFNPQKGTPMLALINIKGTRQEHFIFNKLSSQYIWAFSTTREDADLRERLYNDIGVKDALQILGLKFPNGSAKSFMEGLNKQNIENQGGDIESKQEIDDGIIEKIAKDLSQKSLMLHK